MVLFYELQHWYCTVKVEFSAFVNRLAERHTIQCSPCPEFHFDSSCCFLNPRNIKRIQSWFCKNQQRRWLECKRVTITLSWRPCYQSPSLIRLRCSCRCNLWCFGRWFEAKLFANCLKIRLDTRLLPRHPKHTEENFLMPILFNLWQFSSCCVARHYQNRGTESFWPLPLGDLRSSWYQRDSTTYSQSMLPFAQQVT